MEEINRKVQKSIANREHWKGKATRFYILTVKYDNNYYGVKLLDLHQEIDSVDINGKLDAAKRAGMEMLRRSFPSATISDTTMVHYKDELSNKVKRPSRNGWQKELNSVLKGLFVQAEPFSLDNSKLKRILGRFSEYQKTNAQDYELERQSKLAVLNRIATWLNLISSDRELAKKGLMDFFAARDTIDTDLVKNMEKLLTSQYQQVRNFKALLEDLSVEEFYELFTELIDNGLTLQVRGKFNTHYEKFLKAGKLINPNRGSLLITVQLLALLLSAYDSDSYILYQPKEFSNFLESFGVTFPNDVMERYELCQIAARYVIQYSSDNGYAVEDFVDIYNLVNIFNSDWLGGKNNNMNKTAAKNEILYGPPGTGKPYHVINRALKILNPDIDPDILTDSARRDEAVQLYNRYIESNQVVFCTFHQSYSYEDFVEGIRFVKESEGYEVRDGVFKRICNAARSVVANRRHTYDFDLRNTNFHKISLGNSNDANDDIYDFCIQHNKIAMGWGNQVDYSPCKDKDEIRKIYFK